MSLGNTQMQAILKEYDKTREKNRNILSRRMAQVESKAPAYFDCHRQIISLCMQRANSALFPETADSSSDSDYQKSLAALRAAKEQALLNAGFPADYLEINFPVGSDTILPSFCTIFPRTIVYLGHPLKVIPS